MGGISLRAALVCHAVTHPSGHPAKGARGFAAGRGTGDRRVVALGSPRRTLCQPRLLADHFGASHSWGNCPALAVIKLGQIGGSCGPQVRPCELPGGAPLFGVISNLDCSRQLTHAPPKLAAHACVG